MGYALAGRAGLRDGRGSKRSGLVGWGGGRGAIPTTSRRATTRRPAGGRRRLSRGLPAGRHVVGLHQVDGMAPSPAPGREGLTE